MIQLDGAAFRDSLKQTALALEEAALDALEAAVAAAERSAFDTTLYNDDTRELRASTKGVIDRAAYSAKVSNRAKHAVFIENGTRPHAIVARHASVLRFTVGGRTIFRRRVWHPGTKARPFMRVAGDVGTHALEHRLAELVAQAVHGA